MKNLQDLGINFVEFRSFNKDGLPNRDEEMQKLLSEKIDKREVALNFQDNAGCTLLYLAVRNGYAKTAKMLLEKGADPRIKNRSGMIPLNSFLSREKNYIPYTEYADLRRLLIQTDATLNYNSQDRVAVALENTPKALPEKEVDEKAKTTEDTLKNIATQIRNCSNHYDDENRKISDKHDQIPANSEAGIAIKQNFADKRRDISTLGVNFIEAWEKEISNSDVVVITIGSAGETDKQYNPQFVQTARRAGKKVALLNIDTSFVNQQPAAIEDTNFLGVGVGVGYDIFNLRLGEMINQIATTKQVIVATFTHSTGVAINLSPLNLTLENTNITCLLGYYSHLPVLKLKKNFFNVNSDFQKMRAVYLLDHGITPEKSRENVESCTEMKFYRNNFSKIFYNIDEITPESLGIDITPKEGGADERAASEAEAKRVADERTAPEAAAGERSEAEVEAKRVTAAEAKSGAQNQSKTVLYLDFDGTLTGVDGNTAVNSDLYKSLQINSNDEYHAAVFKNDTEIANILSLEGQKFLDASMTIQDNAAQFLKSALENPNIIMRIVSKNRAEYIKAMLRYSKFTEDQIGKIKIYDTRGISELRKLSRQDQNKRTIVYNDLTQLIKDKTITRVCVFDDNNADLNLMNAAADDVNSYINDPSYDKTYTTKTACVVEKCGVKNAGKFDWNELQNTVLGTIAKETEAVLTAESKAGKGVVEAIQPQPQQDQKHEERAGEVSAAYRRFSDITQKWTYVASGDTEFSQIEHSDGQTDEYRIDKNDSPLGFGWLHYNYIGVKERDRKDNVKVHISIDRDPVNMGKAFDVIDPILRSHKIILFKIAPLDGIVVANSDGKEVTLYMQTHLEDNKESNPEFWTGTVLKEIVEGLVRAGVKKGNYSQGDLEYPGGLGYIYQRQSHNVFGGYVRADVLSRKGFNAVEAATISEDNFLKGRPIVTSHQKEAGNKDSSEEGDKKESQDQARVDLGGFSGADISSSQEVQVGYFTDLGKIDSLLPFVRSNSNPHMSPDEIVYLEAFFGKIDGFCYTSNSSSNSSSKLQNYLVPKTFLENHLNQASQVTKAIINHLKTSDLLPDDDATNVGNIIPAIYHKCFKPFFEAFEENHRQENEVAKTASARKQFESNPFFFAENAREEFIKAVVECSLRTRDSHITSPIPKYIANLNQADVNALVDRAFSLVVNTEKEAPAKSEELERIASEQAAAEAKRVANAEVARIASELAAAEAKAKQDADKEAEDARKNKAAEAIKDAMEKIINQKLSFTKQAIYKLVFPSEFIKKSDESEESFKVRIKDAIKDADLKITPASIPLNFKNSNIWYEPFSGLTFDESDKKNKESIFEDTNLFMAIFNNCTFTNVDFSQIKPPETLNTMAFNNCTFDDGCNFPDNFRFKKSSLGQQKLKEVEGKLEWTTAAQAKDEKCAAEITKNPKELKDRGKEPEDAPLIEGLTTRRGIELSMERLRIPSPIVNKAEAEKLAESNQTGQGNGKS